MATLERMKMSHLFEMLLKLSRSILMVRTSRYVSLCYTNMNDPFSRVDMAARFDQVIHSGVLPYEVLHVVNLVQEVCQLSIASSADL